MKLKIRNVRLAFPNIWRAKVGPDGGEAAFSAAFILPKDHPQLPEIRAAIAKVAKDEWGDKAAATLKALQANDKTCLHDGDSKTEYDGFEGNLFINTRSKIRPSVVDANPDVDLTEADDKVFAGCRVIAHIELWAQNNSYGKRVNAQLRGVQFLKKDERFGGGSSAADRDEYDEISVEDAEDDPLTK